MIDTEHFNMDMIDMEADQQLQYVRIEDICVICGNPALDGAMYCAECADRWLEKK